MNISDLEFPEHIKKIFLSQGIKKLNPPQKDAIENGLLDRENMVVASPTASGKTLIAELAILNNFLHHGKAIYIVPLKALGSEKFFEFREKYESIGLRTAVSIGDFDSADEWLGRYDLIIVTSEKLDSILRHGASWIRDVSLIVTDEIHLLNDPSRGPTLEVVMTRLRRATSAQILALSATIRNADEIANWLDAKLIRSDYRPIELKKGVYYPDKIDFLEKTVDVSAGKPEFVLVRDAINNGKQSLVFVSSRRSAESAAEKIGNDINCTSEKLNEIAKEIETALSTPTKQCKRLSRCVRNGTAFHHAGLVAKQRKIIEDSFKQGHIKTITATPTLAWGVNLPAWRVIIRDLKRFSGYGMDFIPVLEIEQMCGRAGRPKYDKEGQSILVSKSEDEAEKIKEKYIFGETEPIFSKLSVEPVLRLHVLALIADKTCESIDELQKFMEKTFFGFQYGSIDQIKMKLEKIVNELSEFEFLEKNKTSEFVSAADMESSNKLQATPLGRRVAQLYIDPITANNILNRINKITEKTTDFAVLDIISDSVELFPRLRITSKDFENIEDLEEKETLREKPEEWDPGYDNFLSELKTSNMIFDWINEKTEDHMMKKYGIAPGNFYNKKSNSEWLLYSATELARIKKNDLAYKALKKIETRVKNGIKEELVSLIKLKNIGRVRARLLYNNGIKRPSDIKKYPERAKQLVGEKTIEKLL